MAGVAITPGELLERNGAGNLIPHGTSGGFVGEKLVAMETQHADAAGTDQINVDYASADVCYYAVGQPGDVYYMFLKGSDQAYEGSALTSDGAGALQHLSAPGTDETAGSIVAVAEEDLDNSSNGSRVRIKARIV
jgi:hypothetical protein